MKEWTFDAEGVASDFDDYVRGQLPWYDLATGIVVHVARHYIPEHGRVYDLGAATGNVGRSIEDLLRARFAEFIPIERSPAMADKYVGPGKVVVKDVLDVEWQPFDLAVSFLTLMFVAPHRRPELLDRLGSACRTGGAVLFVEKTEMPGGYAGTVVRRMTLSAKVATGVPAEAIVEKELSLSGVQRPVIPSGVEVFRFGEFVGWLWSPE